jgi:hypothetical protein
MECTVWTLNAFIQFGECLNYGYDKFLQFHAWLISGKCYAIFFITEVYV